MAPVVAPAVAAPAARIWTALAQGQRALPLPTALSVDGATLTLREALRIVPGKRAVLRAELQTTAAGEPEVVLAKLFTAAAARQYQRELAGYRLLVAGGLPTPRLLADHALPDGHQLVLYQWLPDAQPLVAMDRVPDPGRFAQLLGLVDRLRAAGLVQRDLHGDNFLFAGDQAWCIDPDAIERHGPAVPPAVLRDNLALLIAQFPRRWQALASNQLLQHPVGATFAAAAARAALQSAVEQCWQRRKREALAKCYRDTTAIRWEQRVDRVVACRRSLIGPDIERFFAEPDVVMAAGELLKDGNSATVVRCRLDGRDVVIKRYNIKGAAHWLRRCWRPSRAWVSWGNGFRLGLLGILTPPPVAFMEERLGPLRRRAWYLCDYVPGEELLAALGRREPTDTELADIEAWFAVARQERLVHGDLKATNLFTASERVWLLDLDAMREVRPAGRWRRLYRKDVARFLRNWPAATGSWQSLIRSTT